MKILLGGIPLGCNNIGDEAIVACVVEIVRQALPGVELTVATEDPRTAERLEVGVVPAYGFAGRGPEGFAEVARGHDAYVWCGATGLSDYPQVGLDLLAAAQEAGVPAYVWCVGMDDELNPVFFRAGGKRRALLGALGLVGRYEAWLRGRLAKRMARILPRCRGVWVRDPQSAGMLARTGYPGAGVAADPAIWLARKKEGWIGKERPRRLGLCISDQRRVADLAGVARMVEAVEGAGWEVVGIPMNPVTDRALMERELGVACAPVASPEDVLETAAGCGVVVSSRLHLLILAADVGTPGIGIVRGSKIANWLANFGQAPAGTVAGCDWEAVARRVLASPGERTAWLDVRAKAYQAMEMRLETARRALAEKLPS